MIDVCTGQPITSPLQATALGLAATSSSFPCGVPYFCVDAGTDLTMQVTAPGYGSEILETLQVQTSRAYTELPIVCTSILSADVSGWSFSLTGLVSGALKSARHPRLQYPSDRSLSASSHWLATAAFPDLLLQRK